MTDGRPIVYLLHGLLETAYGHFGAQIPRWSQRYRLVPLDLPGHGRCPVDPANPLAAVNQAYVASVLRRVGPGRLVAASYLGGPVAVRCALEHPALVHSIVLTGFVPDVPFDVFARWTRSISTAARVSEPLAAAYDRLHGVRWRRTLDAFEQDVQQRYDDTVRVTTAMVGAVSCPLLIANGSVKSAERKAAEGAAGLGPHVAGVVVDGGGHIPGKDQPEAFEAAVTHFWEEAPAR